MLALLRLASGPKALEADRSHLGMEYLMHATLEAKWLVRLPQMRLLAVIALVNGVLVVGCGGGSDRSAARTRSASAESAMTTAVANGSAPTAAVASRAALYCGPDPCLTPRQFRVAYGIQPLLDRGIDGHGTTVTVLVPVPRAADDPTDIRQDVKSFDGTFGLPAPRIVVVTTLGDHRFESGWGYSRIARSKRCSKRAHERVER
jgi:hypothetical protein